MKRVAVDSSSLILLQKVGLLQLLLCSYSVVIAESVFKELTQNEKEGVVELRRLLQDRVAQLSSSSKECLGMDEGERDTLFLYQRGEADFILIDDKKAARYCKKQDIAFINCLLVPRIFLKTQLLSFVQYQEKTKRLIALGYYSKNIIDKAAALSEKRLAHFHP